MSSSPHEPYVSELRHIVTVAGLNYEIWWALKSDQTRPQFVDVLNRYPIYFQTAIHAHFVALLVSLYKLYETRADTYNIPRFLKLLQSGAALEPGVLASLDRQYQEMKPLWVKVSILRNKVFGHHSTAHSVEDAFREAAVTPNELRDLVAKTKSLLNELTQNLDRSTHAFNLGSGGEVVQVLEALQRAKRAP